MLPYTYWWKHVLAYTGNFSSQTALRLLRPGEKVPVAPGDRRGSPSLPVKM